MAFSFQTLGVQNGDYSMQVTVKINNSEYVEGNTGHVTVRAYGSDYTGAIDCTHSFDVTNTNGNTPAVILFCASYYNTGGTVRGYGINFGVTKSSLAPLSVSNSVISGEGTRIMSNRVFQGYDIVYNQNDYTKRAYSLTVEVTANIPVFMGTPVMAYNDDRGYGYNIPSDGTIESYAQQICDGNYTNISEAKNYVNPINSISENQVWSVRCMLKKNGAVISASNKAYDFRIQPDARIWFVLTNRINGDGSANMILHISKSPWLQKIAYAPDDTYATTTVLDSEYWFGNWQDYDTGDAYTGVCSTNIPIFDSDEKGDAYGRGEIGTDEAINGGDTSFSRSTIGDDLSSSDIPTVNLAISGCGSYIYALSEADLKNVMQNYVYTDNQTLQNNIKDGLWLWGNNPADFIIDCYYIPFSISNFYDTITANLKFGTYQIPDTSFSAVKESNGNRIVLFNTSFEGIYGDWRDYTQFDYDLYLPFTSGFVKLDVQKYLNKTLRCEMMFDITTHNLRYYLFADDIVTDRIDGSVGINMPLMATDNVNKAKADRQAVLGGVKTGINTATGIVNGATKIATGNVGAGVTGIVQSATNGVIDGIKVYDTLAEKPTENINGSFSSSMNIYDITYPYLRITERALVIPNNIHNLYGYPSYYMGKASALSGYCEISDIRLNGFTGTQAEAEALKNELKVGVIL